MHVIQMQLKPGRHAPMLVWYNLRKEWCFTVSDFILHSSAMHNSDDMILEFLQDLRISIINTVQLVGALTWHTVHLVVAYIVHIRQWIHLQSIIVNMLINWMCHSGDAHFQHMVCICIISPLCDKSLYHLQKSVFAVWALGTLGGAMARHSLQYTTLLLMNTAVG